MDNEVGQERFRPVRRHRKEFHEGDKDWPIWAILKKKATARGSLEANRRMAVGMHRRHRTRHRFGTDR